MTNEAFLPLFDYPERRAYARWELLDEHAEDFIDLDPDNVVDDFLDLEGFKVFIQGLGYSIPDTELEVALVHKRNMMRYGNGGDI